jgi:tripartite-type tricarboxylate transporter receptor subunit TctC
MRITDLYDVPLAVVPFEGGSEVKTALLGGIVTAGFTNMSQDMLPSLESGEIRALAVGTEERLDYVDAPTFVELDYPELTQSTTTFGVIAPAGTPEEVLQTLENAMRSASEDPEVVEGLDENYVPEEFIGRDGLEELFITVEDTFGDVLGD